MKTDLVHSIENYVARKRDENLIKDCLKGNSAAFAKLMTLNEKQVKAVGMRFFHNQQDAEDFVQDVFLKAWSNLSGFKMQCKFSTWITRIAYTTAINIKNRRKETESLTDENEIRDINSTPEDNQIRQITLEAVQEAIRELPEKYFVCLDLYFFGDASYDDIAEITELPLNTIKSHIFRAKQILRKKLQDFNPTPENRQDNSNQKVKK